MVIGIALFDMIDAEVTVAEREHLGFKKIKQGKCNYRRQQDF